jgi:GTP-binding protein
MFVDQIRVHAKAGDGGDGCVSFRRESFVPKGGPDGGDAGRGGSIILRADVPTDSLSAYFYEPLLRAKGGENGLGKQCSGRAAEDRVYRVPVGTLVYRMAEGVKRRTLEASVEFGTDSQYVDLAKSPDDEVAWQPEVGTVAMELIADLTEIGQEFVLCKGGRGGLGNVRFKSSTNRVPTQFTYGEPGEEGSFFLELRKIADVGLVGYPNAGKSTLLTRLSAARPRVASYPFTTLTPHIGVVETPGYERYSVADIPGLIEGAHRNVGLGHAFLRHIIRCKLLAFVLDAAGSEGRDPIADLQNLRKELDLYDPALSLKPWLILANKMDLDGASEWLGLLRTRFSKVDVIPMSASENLGMSVVRQRLGDLAVGFSA